MDARDDKRKGSLPSIIIESHSNANEDWVTPEDLAWADSPSQVLSGRCCGNIPRRSFSAYLQVWDLNIAAHEEFDLVKQLKKALQEAGNQKIEQTFDGVELQIKTPTSGDSVARKDVKEKSLDQIDTGIADLSLNQDSS
ncbi:hypothetical protein SLEP1_g31079 [Rubroshorea leprosula]|uniref:Uncharacterized protein n=1 Tax=Rubroshorea leprosula TaxID=152421 RepID=A0AAV5K2A4_9ROSI|nr:hypothetical protein SLEP1_g31079 [Rubroshorea leprosula]